MKKLAFDDYFDFAEEVVDSLSEVKYNDDLNDISIIAMYDEAKEIISKLVYFGFNIASIELKNPELGYDDVPYIISLCNIDTEDGEVWCEPFLRKTGYINEEAAITYVMDNCPSECLKTIKSTLVYEVSVNEYDGYDWYDTECSCDCCAKSEKPINKTIHGYYSVNGKEVSRDEFEKFKKKIDDEYMDTVRDMLLKHCSIMDEINQMSRLLRF